ncbi:hypothetical protein B0T20DRAFT_65526 [Sordaria brevicollis]|uniref:Uncharacterized protein n=1 Tax=Sordaria brevicollis TaxID=83679 RepID=A0AAE0U5K9_SORBR|nr:hypothetical protein B0T20DRAFT_65526 [Sordaria brevicollis]
MASNDLDGYIAIGIDFGTTHSAVSWASSLDPDNIYRVTGWPAVDGRQTLESQIPTQIDLETGEWGFLVPKDGTPIRWLKHLLLDTDDLGEDLRKSAYLRKMRELLEVHENATGYGINDVIADFFRAVWKYTAQDIESHVNINHRQVRVAVTVPAAWPEYARQRLVAAVKAGFLDHKLFNQTVIGLFDEPDAAATYALYESRLSPEIEVDEAFIVCDCGGVSVDMSSGYVKSHGSSSVDVQRITPGGGKLCGGFLVDLSFDNWIKRKLSPTRSADSRFQELIKHEWEYTIKRTFSGRDTHEAPLVHLSAHGYGDESDIKIPQDSITQFFAKSYCGVRQLIKEFINDIELELKKPPKKVFLVGGLGSSPYLYSELQSQFQNISQPSDAWSAVVTGAVVMILSARGNAVFDDIIKVEESSQQLSHDLYGVQSTNGSASESTAELYSEPMQASTSENTVSTSGETEQHPNTPTSPPKTPSWKFSLGKLGIFRLLPPVQSSKQVVASTAIATSSEQSLGSETAVADNGETFSTFAESLEGSTEMRYSTTIDETAPDRTTSLDASTSGTPCHNSVCMKFRDHLIREVCLLREQNEEQTHQIEGIRMKRGDEVAPQQNVWIRPRSYADLQREVERLRNQVEILGQQARERFDSLKYTMEKNERLEAQLAFYVFKNGPPAQDSVVEEGGGSSSDRQDYGVTSEEDDNGKRNLPGQSEGSASQPERIADTEASQPENVPQRHPAENASTVPTTIKEIRIINQWDSLCWDIRRWSESLIQGYFDLLRSPTDLSECRFPPPPNTRSRSIGSTGTISRATGSNTQHRENLEEWLKCISESECALSLTSFRHILDFLTTPSPEDWPIVRHRLSWLAEAALWNVLMDRRILGTKNHKSVFNSADTVTVHIRCTLGLVLNMKREYLIQLDAQIHGLATSAILLGRQLRQLSDLWFCEYPRSQPDWNSDDRATGTALGLMSGHAGSSIPTKEQSTVKFDARTMGERSWSISPDVGPDVVVGLVIRPGLINMADPNNSVEAKCHVITLRSKHPTSITKPK